MDSGPTANLRAETPAADSSLGGESCWRGLIDQIIAGLDQVPFGQVRSVCAGVRAKVDAYEAIRLASELGDDVTDGPAPGSEPTGTDSDPTDSGDGSGDPASESAGGKSGAGASGRAGGSRDARNKSGGGGHRSNTEARKAADRAAAIARNPDLANMMAEGALCTERMDTIANAAAESDGAAAVDPDFIASIVRLGVNQGRNFARDWLQRRADKAKLADMHERQRRRRRMSRYLDATRGTDVIKLEGDTASIDEFMNRVRLIERELWRNDGGRDLTPGQHPRTRDQRMFDAAMHALGIGHPRAGVEVAQGPASRSDLAQSASLDPSRETSSPSVRSNPHCACGLGGQSARPRSRPAAVLNLNASDPGAAAELVGSGPISDQAAAEILARADLFVSITDFYGHNLWFGRARRHASLEQFIALAARDRGCVLCGAHWINCEAHHRIPWNSPAAGDTNIEDLVLLCSSCHHHVHANHRTVIAGPDQTWTTRPALSSEIATSRPQDRQRPSRRKPDPDRRRSVPNQQGRARTGLDPHLDLVPSAPGPSFRAQRRAPTTEPRSSAGDTDDPNHPT